MMAYSAKRITMTYFPRILTNTYFNRAVGFYLQKQGIPVIANNLFRVTSDEEPKVRLAFIWASENIATNTPDIYEEHMQVFERLLHDADDRVRMEAPEIFRVLGRRRPELVRPYVEQLRRISETDENSVVRIHCLGAIKATKSK